MSVDYSPEAIERRLREVSQLLRLGEELRKAGRRAEEGREPSERSGAVRPDDQTGDGFGDSLRDPSK